MKFTRRRAWSGSPSATWATVCWLLLVVGAALPAFAAGPVNAAETQVLSGTLHVSIADDFAHGKAHLHYVLQTDAGKYVEVTFQSAPAKTLQSGATVRLRGHLDRQRLVVPANATIERLATPTPSSTPQVLPAVQKRRVLVMLADIVDNNAVTTSVDATCDGIEDDTTRIMFGGPGETVDGVTLESSFGLEGIGGATYPGSAVDVVRVLVNQATPFGTSCDPYGWATAADAAATTAGVTLGNYQHRMYVLPPNVGCSWGGLGEVGCGDNCRAWEATYSYYPCGTRGAHAHELGHNRGMMHASTDLDNDGNIDSEYGDHSDFMGSNFDELQHNNGPHKAQMGWVDAATIVDATAGGVYTLSALELASAPFPQVLKLVPPSGAPIYVSYRAPIGYDVSMPHGEDYLSRTSVHRWAGGYENTLLLARLADDGIFGDPNLSVRIRQVSHDATTAQVEVTVLPSPYLSLSDPVIAEGQAGTTTAVFTLSLSTIAAWPVTATVQTYDGTATAGSDYQAIDWATVTIPAGASSATFPVTVYGDTADEANEHFELILIGLTGAVYDDSVADATIINDDVVLSVADASLTEGDSGQKSMVFTLSLSRASTATVGFRFTTSNGTASAGPDFVAATSAERFMTAGQTSRTLTVPINGDTTIEPTETINFTLSNLSNAQPGDTQAVGFIINDDGPVISINDVAVGEGASGTKEMTFTVRLSKVSAAPVTYNIATSGGDAIAGDDYVALNLTSQVIAAGQLSRTHSVTINGDGTIEPTEVFFINVRQPVGASVWDGQGIGYLLNDDGPTLSVPDASVAEGNSGTKVMTFTVALAQVAAVPVTYSIATASASAAAGSDYTAVNLINQTIPAGELTKTHQVVVSGDTAVEANESFTLTLSNAVGATLYDRQALGFIYNDDGPTLSVNDAVITEGNANTKFATFTVTLSQVAAIPVSYTIATSNGTATAGADYVARALAGETIPAGQLAKTFTVTINGDTAVEANETFKVTLGNPSAGATLFKNIGNGTITNDD
ncbi:MAG: Calx-beta domain-containing protein [Arenimonas sp.]